MTTMQMKGTGFDAGLRFKEILDKVQMQAEKKFDMPLSARNIRMGDNGNIFTPGRLNKPGFNGSPMTDWAFSQLSGLLDIPIKYARRLPFDLRAQNFNYFLERAEADRRFLVRSYSQDGQSSYGPLIRGFLSSDYTTFDDDQLLEMVGESIGSEGDHKILMYHRDEKSMHMRIGFPDLTANIGKLRDGKPDRHMLGIHLINGECGGRSVTIIPMIYRLVCTNGLMRWEADGDMFRQRHIHLNTREMTGRVAEAITNAVNGGDRMIDELSAIREVEIPNPMNAIKKLAESRKYSNKLTDKIVTAFHEEPGETQFHVLQAFTRAARDLQGDERVELERDASRLLKLGKQAAQEDEQAE